MHELFSSRLILLLFMRFDSIGKQIIEQRRDIRLVQWFGKGEGRKKRGEVELGVILQ